MNVSDAPDRQQPREGDLASPLGHARGRQMPGIIILDGNGAIVLTNTRAFDMLRDVASTPSGDGEPQLPSVLLELVPQLRTRLHGRNDTTTAALLTVDVCVRACHMDGPRGKHLLLVLERMQRRDAVAQNLERFSLSPRECDVVMLVLYGHSNRRIADQLFLAEYTVEDHLKRVFTKLGVRSRTALAAKILGWRESQ